MRVWARISWGIIFFGLCTGIGFAADFSRLDPQEKAQLVQGLVKSQPEDTSTLVGFHGASIQTFKEFLRTGRIPAGFFFEPHLPPQYNAPSIYFGQISDRVPLDLPFFPKEGKHLSPHLTLTPGMQLTYAETNIPLHHENTFTSAVIHATSYANRAAQTGRFLEVLDAPYSLESRFQAESLLNNFRHRNHPDFRASLTYFQQLGFTTKEILGAAQQVGSPKGVLFGIKKTIYRDLVAVFDDIDGLRLVVRQGLPLEYIESVIPLGPSEREFLSRITPITFGSDECGRMFEGMPTRSPSGY